MNHDLVIFLQGISVTAAWASGLLFLRAWRQSRDPLFAFFGSAFWLLAASWGLLAVSAPAEETRPYIYGIRLIAFALMIIGMVTKNRDSPARPAR